MSKFAFVVPPFDGHVNPTLSIGNELLKRGNEVVWISVDPKLEANLPAGGKFLFIVHDYDEEAINTLKKEHTQNAFQGLEILKTMYEEGLIPLNQFMLDGIIQYLQEFHPDIVICDRELFAGTVAAARLNIPYVVSVSAPTSIRSFEAIPKIREWEDEQIIKFQQRNGITGDKRLDEKALIILVYTSKLFFGDKELPSFYQFVGPVIKDRPTQYHFDWDRFETMKHRTCVLVSAGATLDNEEMQNFFQKIINALKDEDLTVIMLSDPEFFHDIPDNFVIQKRIPQLQLLPYMQLVICHAGHNTVSETLYHGIPLIVLPIVNDQSQVANDVALCGTGIRLKFKRFKPEDMKNAVHEIINNEMYTKNAQKIQASFKEAGGVDRAVSLLENLVNR